MDKSMLYSWICFILIVTGPLANGCHVTRVVITQSDTFMTKNWNVNDAWQLYSTDLHKMAGVPSQKVNETSIQNPNVT